MKSFFYSLSLTIKSLIIFLLPLVIFGLLFKAAVHLSRSASKVILLILVAVCCSNFISTMISHYIGSWVYHFDLSIVEPKAVQGLISYWDFALPKLIPNDKAMFLAIALGLMASSFRPQLAEKVSRVLDKLVNKILFIFTLILPFFIAGFIIKLNHDGIIKSIIKDYSVIFLVVALAQFTYIGLIYYSANSFRFKEFAKSLKNMFPAGVAGFSTMSSAAVMPLTISGVENNVKDQALGRSIIPATVNIHLIGDCFAIPIFAYAVLKNFGIAEPSLLNYVIFTFYFVLAKFSVAGVPGGGIIVMLPILERYLGFNAEMLSLITALYILFDPVITCANVMGNGGFAMVLSKIHVLFSRKVAYKT